MVKKGLVLQPKHSIILRNCIYFANHLKLKKRLRWEEHLNTAKQRR